MVNKKYLNIAIIGFMATGKTSLGKELSKKLNINFIDTDDLIEKKMKMTITDIFEKYGEKHFREIEKISVEEVSKLEKTLISFGGGVCLDPENIETIRKTSLVILLEARPDTILERTVNDKTRPLLEKKKKNIEKVMNKRKDSYYKAADIIIDTNNKSIIKIRDEIIGKLIEGEKYEIYKNKSK